MATQNKKCWREKVTAEITLTHVREFAQEVGAELSTAEIEQFLNQNGLAHSVWTHMMQAGEEFIKANLQVRFATAAPGQHSKMRPTMIQ